MNFKIDNLQYCNWSREVFQINREAGLDAIHVTIVYHEDFAAAQDPSAAAVAEPVSPKVSCQSPKTRQHQSHHRPNPAIIYYPSHSATWMLSTPLFKSANTLPSHHSLRQLPVVIRVRRDSALLVLMRLVARVALPLACRKATTASKKIGGVWCPLARRPS